MPNTLDAQIEAILGDAVDRALYPADYQETGRSPAAVLAARGDAAGARTAIALERGEAAPSASMRDIGMLARGALTPAPGGVTREQAAGLMREVETGAAPGVTEDRLAKVARDLAQRSVQQMFGGIKPPAPKTEAERQAQISTVNARFTQEYTRILQALRAQEGLNPDLMAGTRPEASEGFLQNVQEGAALAEANLGRALPGMDRGHLEAFGEALGQPQGIPGQIGRAAGESGVYLGLAAPLGGAAGALARTAGASVPLATAAGAATVGAAQALPNLDLNARDLIKQGVAPGRAWTSAIAQAGVEAATEALLPGLGRMIATPARALTKEAAEQAVEQGFKYLAKRAATDGLKTIPKEAFQEEVQQLAQNAIDWATRNPDRTASEAIIAAFTAPEYAQGHVVAPAAGGLLGGVAGTAIEAGKARTEQTQARGVLAPPAMPAAAPATPEGTEAPPPATSVQAPAPSPRAQPLSVAEMTPEEEAQTPGLLAPASPVGQTGVAQELSEAETTKQTDAIIEAVQQSRQIPDNATVKRGRFGVVVEIPDTAGGVNVRVFRPVSVGEAAAALVNSADAEAVFASARRELGAIRDPRGRDLTPEQWRAMTPEQRAGTLVRNGAIANGAIVFVQSGKGKAHAASRQALISLAEGSVDAAFEEELNHAIVADNLTDNEVGVLALAIDRARVQRAGGMRAGAAQHAGRDAGELRGDANFVEDAWVFYKAAAGKNGEAFYSKLAGAPGIIRRIIDRLRRFFGLAAKGAQAFDVAPVRGVETAISRGEAAARPGQTPATPAQPASQEHITAQREAAARRLAEAERKAKVAEKRAKLAERNAKLAEQRTAKAEVKAEEAGFEAERARAKAESDIARQKRIGEAEAKVGQINEAIAKANKSKAGWKEALVQARADGEDVEVINAFKVAIAKVDSTIAGLREQKTKLANAAKNLRADKAVQDKAYTAAVKKADSLIQAEVDIGVIDKMTAAERKVLIDRYGSREQINDLFQGGRGGIEAGRFSLSKQDLQGKAAQVRPGETPRQAAERERARRKEIAETPTARIVRKPKETINVDGVERPAMNSEGKPIAGSDAAIANFWRWFGDSKVVDDEGRPRVVYHYGSFNENEDVPFSVKNGVHFGTKEAAEYRSVTKHVDDFITEGTVEFDDEHGRWYWSSEGIDSFELNEDGFETEEEARRGLEDFATEMEAPEEIGGTLTAAYLKSENPHPTGDAKAAWAPAIAAAKKLGKDGIRYRNNFEDKGSISWLVWGDTQIKSATGNKGAFNPNDPNIRHSIARGTPREKARVMLREDVAEATTQGQGRRPENLAIRERTEAGRALKLAFDANTNPDEVGEYVNNVLKADPDAAAEMLDRMGPSRLAEHAMQRLLNAREKGALSPNEHLAVILALDEEAQAIEAKVKRGGNLGAAIAQSKLFDKLAQADRMQGSALGSMLGRLQDPLRTPEKRVNIIVQGMSMPSARAAAQAARLARQGKAAEAQAILDKSVELNRTRAMNLLRKLGLDGDQLFQLARDITPAGTHRYFQVLSQIASIGGEIAWGRMLNGYLINNMFGPATIAANLVGNTAMMALMGGEALVTGAWNDAIRAAGGEASSRASLKDSPVAAKALARTFFGALRDAGSAFWTGYAPVDVKTGRIAARDAARIKRMEKGEDVIAQIGGPGNALGRFSDTTGGRAASVSITPMLRVIAGVDAFFKSLAFHAALNVQAARDARDAGVTDPADIDAFVDREVSAALAQPIGNRLIDAAMAVSDEATFREKLRPKSDVFHTIERALGVIQGIHIGTFKPIQLFIPFVNGVVRLARQAAIRAPGLSALELAKVMVKVRHGTLPASAIPEQFARMLSGLALFASFAFLRDDDDEYLLQGQSSPATRFDPATQLAVRRRKERTLAGVPYGRIDPIAGILDSIADVRDAFLASGHEEGRSKGERAWRLPGKMMSSLVGQRFTEGLVDELLPLIRGEAALGSTPVERFLTGVKRRATPMEAAIRQTRQMATGERETLFPEGQRKISIFGEELQTDTVWREMLGIGRDQGLDPKATAWANKVAELQRIAAAIPGDTGRRYRDRFVTFPRPELEIDGQKVDLADTQGGKALADYRRLAGQMWLARLGDAESVKIPDPEAAVKMLDYVLTEARSAAVKDAQSMIVGQYPEVYEQVSAGIQERYSAP